MNINDLNICDISNRNLEDIEAIFKKEKNDLFWIQHQISEWEWKKQSPKYLDIFSLLLCVLGVFLYTVILWCNTDTML